MRLLIQPYQSHFLPVSPIEGYRTNLYNHLCSFGVMVYEIFKPMSPNAITVLILNFDGSHERFFHTLWNLDEFEVDMHDYYFMSRLWSILMPHGGAYTPERFDLSLEPIDEPVYFHNDGPSVILEFMKDHNDSDVDIDESSGSMEMCGR